MEAFINEANIFLVVLLLVVGFVLLIKGADFFVDGSSSIAKMLKVPAIIIGLTIVAMGTSLPETAVSVSASLADNNTLAISNVVGSNIFNTMVVIGVCALLTPVMVQRQTITRDIPFSAFVAIVLLVFGYFGIGAASEMNLGRLAGVVLLVLFAGYILVLIYVAQKARKRGEEVVIEGGSEEEIVILPLWKSLLYIIGGGVAIAIGGDLTVDCAARIAVACGMSQTLVGLTIVSVGTSLPELVTSIVAARKNEVDMALGNAIGSNVFNVLMVLGIASAISPISFLTENVYDIIILLGFSLVVWLFGATKKKIDKVEGGTMLLLYAIYLAYIIWRDLM